MLERVWRKGNSHALLVGVSIDRTTMQSSTCLVIQLCLTFCHSMDCSLPGSSVHGILQARILEWVAMPSSRISSQPWDRTQVSHVAGEFLSSEPQSAIVNCAVMNLGVQVSFSIMVSSGYVPSSEIAWS